MLAWNDERNTSTCLQGQTDSKNYQNSSELYPWSNLHCDNWVNFSSLSQTQQLLVLIKLQTYLLSCLCLPWYWDSCVNVEKSPLCFCLHLLLQAEYDRLMTFVRASSRADQMIFFGHYPSSTINGMPVSDIRKLFGFVIFVGVETTLAWWQQHWY